MNEVYWPESAGGGLNFVGYNHAVSILKKAGGNLISPALNSANKIRLYCNIPWHHKPKELKRCGLPLVAYTMFEATKLPDAWRDFLNKECAAIIVPTIHCRDMFRISGVTRPIKICSLGVDKDEFQYVPRSTYPGYNFIWQGMHYDKVGRKACGIVEQAFSELKTEGRLPSESKLFLKYRPHPAFDIEMDYLDTGNGIIHCSKNMSIQELRSLYSKIDCCLNPSRGEGFGLLPLEQMAMGKIVLLTDWSFPFINEKYNIPLKYDLLRSTVQWCFRHIAFGRWGICYNLRGMIREHMMPRAIVEKSNDCLEYGVNLNMPTKVNWTFRASVFNFLCRMQRRLGLFWRPSLPRHEFLLEGIGFDAQVDLEYMKNKMIECVECSEIYRSAGHEISEWALNTWGMAKVEHEFKEAISQIIIEGGF
jgi:hypothetical protein